MEENKDNKGFLLPATIYKLEKYVGVKDNCIVEEIEDSGPALMLCSDQKGTKFIVKFKDYNKKEDISMIDLQTFFKEKAENKVEKAKVLSIKNQLEENEDFMEELDQIIEEKELSRKEAKEFEKTYLSEKAEELTFNFWLNKPGSWIRTTLNSCNLEYTYNGESIQTFESKSIIYDKEGKPFHSGMYYISKTRHSIPLKLYTSKEDSKRTVVLFNTPILKKNNILTLLKHSFRTVNKTNSFYLGFNFEDSKIKNNTLLDLLIKIEEPELKENTSTYLEVLEELINLVENSEETELIDFKNISIFLPGAIGSKMDLKKLIKDPASLLHKYVEGFTNILHPYFKGNEEIIQSVLNMIIKEIVDKRQALYSFYDIVGSDSDEIESETYGWLFNNVKPTNIFVDIEKNIELFELINEYLNKLAEEKGIKK